MALGLDALSAQQKSRSNPKNAATLRVSVGKIGAKKIDNW